MYLSQLSFFILLCCLFSCYRLCWWIKIIKGHNSSWSLWRKYENFLSHIFVKRASIHVEPKPGWAPFHAEHFVQYNAAAKMHFVRCNPAKVFIACWCATNGDYAGSVRIKTKRIGVWRRRLKSWYSRWRRREPERSSSKTRWVNYLYYLLLTWATAAECIHAAFTLQSLIPEAICSIPFHLLITEGPEGH